MVRFQMFIPEETLAALKANQQRTGASVAYQVREAINAYLDENDMAPVVIDPRQLQLDLA